MNRKIFVEKYNNKCQKSSRVLIKYKRMYEMLLEMKRNGSRNKGVLFAMSAMIFLLQLTVAVTSCFIWAKSLHNFFGKINAPSVLEWLQCLDGVESKVDEKIFRKTRFLTWFMRNVFLQITALTEWCSIQYVSCLVFSFSCQALVALLVKQKWLAETSVSCLMSFTLLITSQQRFRPYFLLADVVLSGFACGISLYLLMMFSVAHRMFGRATKKRKKTLEVELRRACRNEEEGMDEKTPNYITKKLKLPEELMFAEENYHLDANISSLSLGPLGENGKESSRSGTWFGSKLYPSFKEAGIVTNTHSSTAANNMLIWPARFHMNGLNFHSRSKENGMSEAKTESIFQDFSDDEFCCFSQSEKKNRKKSKESENEIECQRDDSGTKRCYERCSVLRVILVCSLALNACFLWLLKDTIKKTVFKT